MKYTHSSDIVLINWDYVPPKFIFTFTLLAPEGVIVRVRWMHFIIPLVTDNITKPKQYANFIRQNVYANWYTVQYDVRVRSSSSLVILQIYIKLILVFIYG